MDGARRGFLRLCALAPVGLPALAQAARGPAASEIWAPQATLYCVGADVQAETVVFYKPQHVGRSDQLWREVDRALADRDFRRVNYRALRDFGGLADPSADRLTDSQRERAAPLSQECAALRLPCAPTLARQGAAGAPISGGLS